MRIVVPCCAAALILTIGTPAPGQDAKKGPPELQGTWRIVARITNTETYDVPANMPRWVIKGNQIRYGGEAIGSLTVDTANNPRTIDLTFTDKKDPYEGVYKIDGDTLTICVNRATAAVKERPLDFAAESKEDRQLLVLQKLPRDANDGSKDGPGFVGIQIAMMPDDMSIFVNAVIDKSPAKKAGLMKDDVILKVGDTPATGVKQVVDLVRAVRTGNDIVLHVRRGEKEQDITVRAGVVPFMLFE